MHRDLKNKNNIDKIFPSLIKKIKERVQIYRIRNNNE